MPIQLNYTDADNGINFPNMFWRAEEVNMNSFSNRVVFTLYGYPTQAAATAGKRFYTSKTFVASFAQLGLTLSSTMQQVLNALYTFALTASDPNGQIFFQGGTIV